MIDKTKVYIIIVTYNGMKWIENCLNRIKNSLISFDIIIIDNCSSDGTVEFIKLNFKNVVLFEQNKNIGFGAANNIGIAYALNKGAEYFFLMNQDVYLYPDTIERLIFQHKNNKEFGVLSPLHFNGEGNCLDKNFAEYIKYNLNFYFDAITKKLKGIYSVPFVNAAAWLISKNTFDIIGGFDPIFFHYGEDDNFCQRLRFHKIELGVVSDSFICHDRESRVILKENGIKQVLKNKEKDFKLKWADINIELNNDIDVYLKKLKFKIFKSKLKLRFKNANALSGELKVIKKIKQEILNSRSINLKKGRHYL